VVELERLYNHVTDIGALCNDVGHGVLHAHAGRVRERLLRLNDHTTGHRLLRGAIYPGGATVAHLPAPSELAAIAEDVREIAALASGHSVVHDRFAGTAVLTAAQATDLGALGYVARASGLTIDARHDHPAREGGPPPRTTHEHTSGDVLARFHVRVEEVAASVAYLHTLLAELDGRRHSAAAAQDLFHHRPPAGSGVGIVEGWRGTIVHRVEITSAARLSRVKVVDPSFFNWPALPVALADTIVPDFPLVNKSFNLSYAGNDL
jgi:Ni,Fe-hydrogenase III large subunit